MSRGRDLIREFKAERAYKKSVQEMMDETMCRPGYRWLDEPLNRCIPAAVPASKNPPTTPSEPTPEPAPEPPSADDAISAEVAKREKSKGM